MVTATRDGYDGDPFIHTSEEVAQAFAVLGLAPSAGADLVDLAYWHLVDEARSTLYGTPAWRARLSELNAARACLSDHLSIWRSSAHRQLDAAPRDARIGWRWRRVATLAPVLAALPPAALLASNQGLAWPERAVAAGAVLLLSMVGALLIARSGRGHPERAMADAGNPYHRLHLHPRASPSLADVVYEHLRRAALQRDDLPALAELERAYAQLRRSTPPTQEPRTGVGHAHQAGAEAEHTAAPPRRRIAPHWLRRLRPSRRRRPSTDMQPAALQRGRGRPWARWLPRPVLRLRWRTAPSRSDAPAPSHTLHPAAAPKRGQRSAGTAAPPVAPAPVSGGEAGRLHVATARPAGVLQVVRGAEGVQSVPLEDGSVYTIGTAAHCQVALPASPGVAAEHARLTVRGGRVRFHHVAEAGASLVNGKPTTWAVLEPGDEIRVGPYVCRYLAEDRPAPNMTLGVRESAPAVHATTSPSVPNGST